MKHSSWIKCKAILTIKGKRKHTGTNIVTSKSVIHKDILYKLCPITDSLHKTVKKQ